MIDWCDYMACDDQSRRRLGRVFVTQESGGSTPHAQTLRSSPGFRNWRPNSQGHFDLSWSHYYVELLKLDDSLERSFYEQKAIREKWSVPELKRQKKSSLFLRLAAGKDKASILQLSSQGQIIAQPADILRDSFVFEFLKVPEPHAISETDLKRSSATTSRLSC